MVTGPGTAGLVVPAFWPVTAPAAALWLVPPARQATRRLGKASRRAGELILPAWGRRSALRYWALFYLVSFLTGWLSGGIGQTSAYYVSTAVTVSNSFSAVDAPLAVTSPDAAVATTATSYPLAGTAPSNSCVRVYRDTNNNNLVDVGETIPVASVQLDSGLATWSVSAALNLGVNDFVVTATPVSSTSPGCSSLLTESAPLDVPSITRASGTSGTIVGSLGVQQTSDTAINLTATFRDDVNGNGSATYAIECLAGTGCPSPFGSETAMTRGTEKYTASRTGLVANNTYRIRVTYSDADGVIGDQPQYLTFTIASIGGACGSRCLEIISVSPDSFSSLAKQDTTIKWDPNSSQAQDGLVEAFDSTGALVKVIYTCQTKKPVQTQAWAGTTTGNVELPDGSYTLRFRRFTSTNASCSGALDSQSFYSVAISNPAAIVLSPTTGTATLQAGSCLTATATVYNSQNQPVGADAKVVFSHSLPSSGLNTGSWSTVLTSCGENLTVLGAKTDASGVATISFRTHPSLCTTFGCPTNLKLDAAAGNTTASTIVTAIDTSPTVKSTFPEHQDQTVHRHTTVQITFSEAMNQTSVFNATTPASSAFCLFLATSTCATGRVTGAGSWSTDGTTFTFDPTVDLLAGQKYRVTIGTSAQDIAGNSLASAYSFSFQTTSGTDAVQPTVVKSWPRNNESDVSVASKILIEFSEPMERQSTERAFCLSTATACGGTVVAGSFDWAEGDTKLNFAPATSLSANATYHVRVCADADTCTTKAQDVAGNNLLRVLPTTTFSFVTATTSQPRAEISFPREAQHVRGTSVAILGTAGNGDTNFNRYELKWGDTPDNCSNLVKNSSAVNQVFTESTYPTGIGNGTLGLWDTTQVVSVGQTDQKYLCLEVSNDSGPKVTTKVSVIIDNAVPVVSAIAPTATNKTTKRAGQTVTVNFAHTETYPASYLIRVCGDGSSDASCGSTKLGEQSFSGSLGGGTSIPITDTLTLTATAAAGNYDLRVTVTDEAGNTGSLREIGAVVVQGSASFVVTADKTDLSPGQITTIRATVRDSANNPLNSQTVTFTKDNSCTGSQLVPTTVVAGVNGEYTTVMTACSTAFASITVRATTTVAGTALSDSVTIYDPPPAPPEDLELSVGSIRLRWRPSPSPDVAGYTIYVGTQSGQYDRIFDAGLTTSHRIEDVTPGTTYYVVMRSYDRSGQFGPTTTEASLTLPAAQPTATATATVSATTTASGTATVALSSGITTTATASTSGTTTTATPLASGTVSATATPVASPSGSAAPSPIGTPAATPTGTVVPSRTPTPTPSPAGGSAAGGVAADATATPAPSATATAPSRAWTATPTVVATLPPCVPPLPSLTATPSVASGPSVTPPVSAAATTTVIATTTPTVTTTATVTGSTTPTPSGSPTVASSTTPSPTVTGSPTAAVSTTATPVTSVTVTVVPTTTVPATATPTSVPSVTATATTSTTIAAGSSRGADWSELPAGGSRIAVASPTPLSEGSWYAASYYGALSASSPTATSTPTWTPSPTATSSPVPSQTSTNTSLASVTPTSTVGVSATPTTTAAASVSPTGTPAGIATGTPVSVVSATASPTATVAPTATVVAGATATAPPVTSVTPSPSAVATATPTATMVAASPTATSTITPTGPATSTPSAAAQCGDSGSTGSVGIVAPATTTPTATVTRTPSPTGPRPAGPDAYEPNDTTEQARPITLGQTYGSYLETASDVDYFRVRVSVPEGETRRLHVRVYNLPVDADLTLQGPTGADLGTARHRGSTAVELRVTAVVSGEYLIKLAAVNAGSDRPYSFIVSAQ